MNSEPAGRDSETGPMDEFPRIVAVDTAVPAFSYSQEDLLEIFQIRDPKITSVFRNSSIKRRFLTLPPTGPDGNRRIETQGELLRKHRIQGLDMGSRALLDCLKRINANPADVRYLCCVTSTGFLTPGFSALLIREMGLNPDCARIDVVGMGCNAGLNGLNATAGWARSHPGELAILLCVEACSAAYVFDGTMRTSVVNSLFGDGAVAAAIVTGSAGQEGGVAIRKFASFMIPEAIDAMRYEWDDQHNKFSFFLDRDVPYVVGAHAEIAMGLLLNDSGVRLRDIDHWLVHSGGKKVIDSVMVNLALTRHDVRHTMSVLRDYGNLSSGSFLFSYKQLIDEDVTRRGDYGVLMTMGPGSTIETALVQW